MVLVASFEHFMTFRRTVSYPGELQPSPPHMDGVRDSDRVLCVARPAQTVQS